MSLRFPLALMLLSVAFLPFSASAASNKPMCSLNVSTSAGEVRVSKDAKIYVQEGDDLEIKWTSDNAKKAVDEKGKSISLSGSETESPDKTTKYSYTFSSGSKKVTCSVTAYIAEGSIDSDTLSSTDAKRAFSGKVTGVKSVTVQIRNADGDVVYKSKTLKVKRGTWTVNLVKGLDAGKYEISLYGDKKYEFNELANEKFTVGGSSAGTDASSVSITTVPLLFGGTVKAGGSVPVAYIRVVNTTQTPAKIKGFWLKQNGTAPAQTITGFTTSDDKGGSRMNVTGTFTNGAAFIPLAATVVQGQPRIFTIKAVMSSDIASSIGTTLMIDTTGVDSSGKVTGTFPLRGTTWTLAY
ncbi:MAG: hypothetical protein JWN64_737 [Parcubacteria group bacterium]|nr:hypothetical protein [Parcubacteria group bacterium]